MMPSRVQDAKHVPRIAVALVRRKTTLSSSECCDKPELIAESAIGHAVGRSKIVHSAVGLKDGTGQTASWLPPLLRAGYTVFAINHRATPRFHYPAPLEGVQRAVRFVRHMEAALRAVNVPVKLVTAPAQAGAGSLAGEGQSFRNESPRPQYRLSHMT